MMHLSKPVCCWRLLVPLALAMFVATTSSATVVESWETATVAGDQGAWTTDDPLETTLSITTTGATHGIYALQVTTATGGWRQSVKWADTATAAIEANTTLLVDVTLLPDSFTIGEGQWLEAVPVLQNADNGWWFQGPNFPLTVGDTTTVQWNYAAQGWNYGDPGAAHMLLVFNSHEELFGDFYVDNVRFVPEPGTMALVGLGALVLGLGLVRRRNSRRSGM